MGIRGEIFSTKVIFPNRTYFFNVKENRMGDLYLNIVESKNRETGGFERQSVILFAEDLQEFLKGFDESLKVLEKAVREKRRTSPEEKRSAKPADRERRSYKPADGEKRSYKPADGEKRSYKPADGEKRSYKSPDGEKRSYKPADGEKRSYKPAFEEKNQQRSFQGREKGRPPSGGRRAVVKKRER